MEQGGGILGDQQDPVPVLDGDDGLAARVFAEHSRERAVPTRVRVAIGPLALGQLPKGAVRSLNPREKKAIDQAMQNRVRA